MKRVFSVLRRKSGFVDLSLPLVDGVDGYRIKSATNWDAASTEVFTSSPYGFIDSELRSTVVPTMDSNPNAVRIIFKPSKYSLSDNGVLWLQVAYVKAGVEQNSASATPPGAITMISPVGLPYNAMQALYGFAPSQTTLSASTQIDLGRQADNITIANTFGADLYAAFDSEGPEFVVQAGSSTGALQGTVSSIYVRGDGAAVPFRMTFVNANPR